jgi:Trypsin-co-occurring domain 2
VDTVESRESLESVDDSWIGLAEAVRVLRAELAEARFEGVNDPLRFELGPVEVEFAVSLTREGGIDGGVRLGVVSISAKGGLSSDSSHRVKLVLNPKDAATGRAAEIAGRVDGIPDR